MLKDSITISVLLSMFLFPNLTSAVHPLTKNIPHHIETSQLICIANRLNGFHMVGEIRR